MNIKMGEKNNYVSSSGENSAEKEAYLWAIREFERIGCVAHPVNLTFESDSFDKDEGNCIISVFRCQETGYALLRRDWFEDNSVDIAYDVLNNFDEALKMAPKSVNHFLSNAVKLYYYYDGPNGGVTRKMNKEWI